MKNKLMGTLVVIMGLSLTACGTAGNSNAAAALTSQAQVSQTNGLVSTDNSDSSSITLTYYSLSQTIAPLTSWPTKTYTATGYCVVYQSNTYCWDDGDHTIEFTSDNFTYGPYTYNFWGMDSRTTGTPWGQCSGGCQTDLMSSPTLITEDLTNNMADPSLVNEVLDTGNAIQVSCTESNGLLDCGDFTINLNQLPL